MQWIRSGIEILRSRRSLAVVAGMKKSNDHAEPTKVERTKEKKKGVGLLILGEHYVLVTYVIIMFLCMNITIYLNAHTFS